MEKMIKAIAVLAIAFTVGCGKKGGGGAAVSYYQRDNVCYNSTGGTVDMTHCNGLAYYAQGGQCYTRSNGQIAPVGNCNMAAGVNNNGQYYYNNGVCMDRNTGYQVSNPALCTNTGVNGTCNYNQAYGRYVDQYGNTCNQNGTGYGANNCNGRSVFVEDYYGSRVVLCGGYNVCRGWFIDASTYQNILCQ